ncbi:uncharacterized protein CEXT_480651 [Caerostris extrusa]|uniref:Monocarboxylate transporter n=1 Tax=Caerostris extrusa TaxID=172846 RepID=A0AAV4N4J3_CAEEX|nr:uncharacterized protein CEXT_480651 [Caerostris extrusa]
MLTIFPTGLCTALTTTLNQVPIDEYFERHRTTAGGLAFSGGCVGAFLFPVVLEALISHYGMNGAFMGMGIILLIVIPAALTLRHPPWRKENPSAKKKPDKGKPSTYNTFPVSGVLNKSLDSVLSNSNRFGVESSITFKETPKDVSTKSSNLLDGSSGDITYKGLNLSDRSSKSKHLNFTVLRQNSEMVYQLFSLTMPPEAMLQDSILDTSPIVNELEELHKFLVKTRKPKIRPMDIGVIMDELTRSVHIVQVTNQTTPNDDDDSEPASYEDNPRWFFMATKLKELCETYNEEDIVHYFPPQLHDTLLKILDILKEMNRLIRATSLEQAVESITKNNASNVIDIPTRQQRLSISSNGRKKKKEHSNSFLEHIMTAIRLHKNPAFLLISMCRGVFMLTFIPMVTIVVDFAIDKGLTKDTGKYVIATLSLGDLVGRLCLGWITDSGCLGLPAYMVLAMLLLGCSTATLPFAHSEVSLFPAVLIFGMLQGSLFIRHQVLISRYMGSHEQTIGMGFINLLSGVLGFVIPYYLNNDFQNQLAEKRRILKVHQKFYSFVQIYWLCEDVLREEPTRAVK